MFRMHFGSINSISAQLRIAGKSGVLPERFSERKIADGRKRFWIGDHSAELDAAQDAPKQDGQTKWSTLQAEIG